MKTTLIKIGVLLLLICGLITFYQKWQKTQKEYERAILNNKAFVMQNDSLKDKTKVFEFTINQMQQFKDSINDKMLQTAKELGIKEKTIESTQYIKTEVVKRDTIILKDTVFKQRDFKLDTIISDKWYENKIHLEYPNQIITEPKFKNEQYIIVNSKKEYINKPSKIFFIRWFQKKHTVLEVTVKNTNPYIDIQENRFIKIIKR